MKTRLPSNDSDQLANRVMVYCETLAQYSQSKGEMDRRYLTLEHKQTNQQLCDWANEYELNSWQDQAGNQWIRLEAGRETEKRLIIGSHSDTVPNGGKYDGILGVVAPLVLLQHFAQIGLKFDFHIDVVAFGDEEGTRFGATLLGSSAISGKWKSAWRELTDENGITLAQAMRDFSLDVSKVSEAKLDTISVLAYLELHIEQGPVLEERSLPISAVKGIAGARRFFISIKGKAGHAGTVPMESRQDPLITASQWITEVNQSAQKTSGEEHPVLATVGKFEVFPGGVNVLPGRVELSLDARSINDDARDELLERSLERLESLAEENRLILSFEETHSAKAVSCDVRATELMSSICEQITGDPLALTSGAGHDAMVMADIVPTTMLFMRCKEGISHNPKESIKVEDVSVALRAVCDFIYALPLQGHIP